ncbi:MAG TPA: DUF4212 domain-containing protein [Burkholderiaceae bacterium]|nr:DUF4212 domain-containing protein [Burkholderiaceae bacterium]
MPSSPRVRLYWHKNLRLTAVLMIIWFAVTFVMPYFARDLNFDFFGWPFSFYMAAQGSLVVYVVITWYYARRMNQLDHEFGLDEEGDQ